jgi:GxxExxY protein
MDTDVHDRDGTRALTRQVIGAAFEVANCLGSGLLEKVYENALVVELS